MGAFVAENKDVLTLTSAVVLACLGYIVKYANDLAIARRRDRLDRVNLQLRLLYGPLYALSQATNENWLAFRKRYKSGEPFFNKERPPNQAELEAWRLWMVNTFMPLNRRMVDLIIANNDLLDGTMPQAYLDLIAHVGSYEVVLARWAKADLGEHVALNDFPNGIREEVASTYNDLRKIQRKLLVIKAKA